MIKVKNIHGNGIYVLEGLSSANTHFVENKKEVTLFLNLIDKRLGRYMRILEYVIEPTGWQLIVETKSEYIIKKVYENNITHRKTKPRKELNSVRLIISEAIRLLRSRFTNITNPLRGREGNASKQVYSKYMFSNVEEANTYITKLRNREIDISQPNDRYQPDPAYYDENGALANHSALLSSKTLQEGNSKFSKLFFRCLKFYNHSGKEFEKLISRTLQLHNELEVYQKKGDSLYKTSQVIDF